VSALAEEVRSFGGRGLDPSWDRARSTLPTHRVRQVFDYGDGLSCEHTTASHWLTPEAALAHRVKRLHDAGTPHTVAGMTVTYTDRVPEPHTVTLTYLDPA